MLCKELEKIYCAHKRRAWFGGKNEAVGILERMWDWCSKYAIRGDIGKWPNEVICEAIGWRWNPDELICALIGSNWLDAAETPFRLVIHDIKDHASNGWRQNLENAGLTWWDGSPPRKYKLQTNSKQTPKIVQTLVSDTDTDTDTEVVLPPTPAPQAAGKVKRVTTTHPDPEREAWFAEWYGVYPKHEARGDAEKAFRRHVTNHEIFERVIKATKAGWGGLATELQFIPYPATWLNRKPWEEPPTQASLALIAKPNGAGLSFAERNTQIRDAIFEERMREEFERRGTH